MAIIELAVDIGTTNITVFQKGKGIVLQEPTVAIAASRKNKLELLETGRAAEKALSASLGSAQVIYPVKEGIIVHEECARLILKDFLKRIIPERIFAPTVKAVVLIPCGLSIAERRAVENVCVRAGIREVTLVESPLALIAYTNSIGGLFVDIGGGTSEIACVSRRGIASGVTLNIAGNAFNARIIDHVADKYGLKIGDYTAEQLKAEVGSMLDNDVNELTISGRDRLTGEPRTVTVCARDVKDALAPVADNIIEVIMHVLNMAPPELLNEIRKKGIFFSGGSARLVGLSEYISVRIDLPVTELDALTEAVALGGGRLLEEPELLAQLLNIKR